MQQKERIYSIQKIMDLFKENKLNFYLEYPTGDKIERKDDWDAQTKSNLIHSIINGNIITPIYIYKKEDELYVIDGKERLKSIMDYINNEYALEGYLFDKDGNTLTDKAFYSLKSRVQSKILNYRFTVIEQTGTLEEAIETFVKCNAGVRVKPIELFRAKMGQQLSVLKNICSHKFFGIIELGNTNNFNNYELALYLYMLEANPGIGLAKKEKENFILNINQFEKYKKVLEYNVLKKLDYLFSVFNNKNYLELNKPDKYLKKSHILILYKLSLIAITNKIKSENFFNWANKFFYTEKNSNNVYWIESSRGSTTAKSSMDIRFTELKLDFDNYFSIKNNEEIDKKEEITSSINDIQLSILDEEEEDDMFGGYVM